ncbi:MAG: hypothetical protein HY554_11515 [Elusimicrobia bacterium]|nr:hypothetical protein [Elusimicrobiota bacterium]
MRRYRFPSLLACLLLAARALAAPSVLPSPVRLEAPAARLAAELGPKLDEAQRSRLGRGLRQAAALWRPADGDAAAFEAFVRANFAADAKALDEVFTRFQGLLETVDGHMDEIMVGLRAQSDLDRGPLLPLDEAFAGYDPAAHVSDDFFANKLAFVALLNFPVTTLEERLAEGPRWTRRQWAEARLASRFSKRVPAEVQLAIAEAGAQADRYISGYNVWMRHVLSAEGERLFPPKLRLLSHWNLRDEIKASYSEPKTALAKQRTIQKVLERIVTQTIPEAVVDKPYADWNPFTNAVQAAPAAEAEEPAPAGWRPDARPEPDRRYATLWQTYAAAKRADPYVPAAPSLIARRFEEDRELPEARVRAMLEQVLGSPLVPKVAALIQKRLGRDLEPFDVWYAGFKPNAAYTSAQLDALVSKRYPDAAAYAKDMPALLEKLGFARDRAEALAARIVVEPARGSGHAWGPQMRSSPARLRTRVEKGGMNYKGFNIAVHEMGHNVEQVLSLYDVDHTLLRGVPNTAFTEALAFVFQGRDLELLDLSKPDERSRALKTLEDFWATYEIAGVALVDMGVWHWMYDHPQATPAELREAAVGLAKDVWNRYYAPVFGRKDVVLLGVYSHMIHSFLYLPDYPIGHMIAFQIDEKIGDGPVGPEFERMARLGRVTPDEWMIHATGKPVGPEALLAAAERALKAVAGTP